MAENRAKTALKVHFRRAVYVSIAADEALKAGERPNRGENLATIFASRRGFLAGTGEAS